MGQAKNRKNEIANLKANGPQDRNAIAVNNILSLVSTTAELCVKHGINLTEDGIFAEEDCAAYQMLYSKMRQQKVPYRLVLDAMEIHDNSIKEQFGADLSQFNGDMSLLYNHAAYIDEKAKIPTKQRFEVALFDGINGSYAMGIAA